MVIKIPIRVHLLKYLRGKVGADKLDIKHINQMELFADQSDIIFIQRELSKNIYPFINTTHNWKPEHLGVKYKFGMVALNLKDYLINSKKLFISYDGVKKLNESLYDLMMNELMGLLDESIVNKTRHDEAIINFMNKYEIDEDDIRFDSLKRKCYRERARLAEQIFLENNLKMTSGVIDLSFGNNLVQS